jgi:hypothetical protein
MRPVTGLLFIPQVIHEYGERKWEDDGGKPKTSEKNQSQCCFFHTYPTCTDPGANLSHCGEGRELTSELWHGRDFKGNKVKYFQENNVMRKLFGDTNGEITDQFV